jgi:S-adenosylmethionine-dependent methyltransferase
MPLRSPYGARLDLLLEQVLAALPPPPAQVVDAGGGTGQVAVALARGGHRVTVLDTSAAMLATCAQRAADEGPGVAGRVTTVQGDAADAAALLGADSHDAALCHDVVGLVDDPAGLLAALALVLRPGGVLSLTFANRDWLALRAARQGDYAGALALVAGTARAQCPTPGAPPHRAYTLAEAESWLAKAGFELAAACGVGVFAAADADPDPRHAGALLQLERRVAGHEPYRSSAQIVHLVGRRTVLRPELPRYTP